MGTFWQTHAANWVYSDMVTTMGNATLIIITILAVAVVTLAYALSRALYMYRSAQAHNLRLMTEARRCRDRMISITGEIEKCAGGVTKRISEHTEIEAAIATHASNLFVAEPGLKHWLTANRQFFDALLRVVGDPMSEQAHLREIYANDDVAAMVGSGAIRIVGKGSDIFNQGE